MIENKLLQLFCSFVKIGTFTFGGGYAMLPVIEREVVAKRNWVDEKDWLDMVVIAQTAPGILAMNISILVGSKTYGKRGAVVAALGSALPSFFVILIFAIFVSRVQESPIADKMFRTVRPAIVALIAVPVFSLGKSANVNIYSVWYVIAIAIAIALLGVSPIYIIMGAITIGIAYTYYLQRRGKK